MPRYFFHLHDDLTVPDEDGMELADLEAAKACGIKEARSVAVEQVREGKLDLNHRIDVADEQSVVVHTIRFAAAIEVATQRPG
jgi:hypothetical protein